MNDISQREVKYKSILIDNAISDEDDFFGSFLSVMR